jgi:hypothetical protein
MVGDSQDMITSSHDMLTVSHDMLTCPQDMSTCSLYISNSQSIYGKLPNEHAKSLTGHTQRFNRHSIIL